MGIVPMGILKVHRRVVVVNFASCGAGFLPPSKMSPSRMGFLAILIFLEVLGSLWSRPRQLERKLLRNYATRSRFFIEFQRMPLHILCFSFCLNDLTAAFFMFYASLRQNKKNMKKAAVQSLRQHEKHKICKGMVWFLRKNQLRVA